MVIALSSFSIFSRMLTASREVRAVQWLNLGADLEFLEDVEA